MEFAEQFALIAVFIGVCAQSITGMGFALTAAPFLTIALGGATAFGSPTC